MLYMGKAKRTSGSEIKGQNSDKKKGSISSPLFLYRFGNHNKPLALCGTKIQNIFKNQTFF